MSGALPILEADVLDYLKAHPETAAKVVGAIPPKDRCRASIALGAIGIFAVVLSVLGYAPPDIGALGGAFAASAGVLVREFCGK